MLVLDSPRFLFTKKGDGRRDRSPNRKMVCTPAANFLLSKTSGANGGQDAGVLIRNGKPAAKVAGPPSPSLAYHKGAKIGWSSLTTKEGGLGWIREAVLALPLPEPGGSGRVWGVSCAHFQTCGTWRLAPFLHANQCNTGLMLGDDGCG